MVTRSESLAARARISKYIRETPILTLEPAAFHTSEPTVLKLENLQRSGSFKIRGMSNQILVGLSQRTERINSISVASTGNAGIAAASVASQLGIPARIYLPSFVSPFKLSQIRHFGGVPIVVGECYEDAEEAALEGAAQADSMLVHAYDQSDLVAGHGTIAIELLEQSKNHLDTILVPVGGGGLLAGIATVLGGLKRVVAVEPESGAKLSRIAHRGENAGSGVGGAAGSTLGVRRISQLALTAIERYDVPCVTVTEESILLAANFLRDNSNIVVEYSSAIVVAALLEGAYRPEWGEIVALVLTGANIEN